MDYEKKYKEANDKVAVRFGTNVAKEIFTDLYESEDERIRKDVYNYLYNERHNIRQLTPYTDELDRWLAWLEKQKPINISIEDKRIKKSLINYVKAHGNGGDFTKEKYIAWLEKQESVEEIVERCKNSWYNEGKIAGMAEGLTDDEKYQQGWHDALEKQGDKPAIIDIDSMVSKYANTKEACTNGLPVNCQIRAYRQGINDALRLSLNLEKQGEQKPQRIISAEAKEAMYDKPAWSEEDENNLYLITTAVEQKYSGELFLGRKQKEIVCTGRNLLDWLKSLKERITQCRN